MAPKTITIIGSLNTDLVTTTPRIPSGGETLTATSFTTGSGGKGANQAVASARLSRPKSSTSSTSDIKIRMLGAVGSDSFGADLISSLEASGIDTSSIRTTSQPTGVAVIIIEALTGENRILFNPGANYSLQPSDFTLPSSLGSPLPDLLVLQLEIPFPTILQILSTAKEAHVSVLLNPAPAVELPETVYAGLAHLIVNESEAAILTGRHVDDVSRADFAWGDVTAEFLGRGVQNVVVTLGAKGAFFASVDAPEGAYIQGEKVRRVVDTTAAGDTFVGAYAVSVVRKGTKAVGVEDVKWACKAAGRTVEKKGAQSAIPWADEVDVEF